jgi:indolepyruvate ferredoxin oxidoreductase beta subunit
MAYPADLLSQLTNRNISVYPLDGFSIAKGVGEIRTTNLVLVGALSTFLPVDEEVFLEVLKKRIPRKLNENIAAFKEGRKITA